MTEERDRRGSGIAEQGASRRDIFGCLASSLILPSLSACAGLHPNAAKAAASPADDKPAALTVVIDQQDPGPSIATGYAGFSYEKNSLITGFFAASNLPLVRLFRRLGTGLLRLGGNTVDRTGWQTSSSRQTGGPVTPSNVDALSTFLHATGWSVLYGLNMATNTPAAAANEAAYAARTLGRHLYGFEIGNEPDAYSINHLRPPSYSYAQFLIEWNAFASAVSQAVPGAGLTGPASAWHETNWTVPFARDEGHRIILLTQHYYRANGLSPQSTLELLLAGDPALPGLLAPLRRASTAAHIRDGYRLTEANSFYDGGAPHISNTFGTALWTIDFLFANARLGSSGVNFHGGGDAPGYTPIADNGREVVGIRPEYYGILLFSLMGPGRLLSTVQSASTLAVSAHAVASSTGTQIILVNKEPASSVDVTIWPGKRVGGARLTSLSAPTLNSVSGMLLSGAPVRNDGTWSPRAPGTVKIHNGSIGLRIGPASAMLVTAV